MSNLGIAMNEAFRVRGMRGIERDLALLQDRLRSAVMDVCGRQERE